MRTLDGDEVSFIENDGELVLRLHDDDAEVWQERDWHSTFSASQAQELAEVFSSFAAKKVNRRHSFTLGFDLSDSALVELAVLIGHSYDQAFAEPYGILNGFIQQCGLDEEYDELYDSIEYPRPEEY